MAVFVFQASIELHQLLFHAHVQTIRYTPAAFKSLTCAAAAVGKGEVLFGPGLGALLIKFFCIWSGPVCTMRSYQALQGHQWAE